jgi:cystathionine beta-lyase/cystathionine gamma-synthase
VRDALVRARTGYISLIRALLRQHGYRIPSYLLVRGLKTFALRMERQNAKAQAIAEFLAGHPRIDAVHYAGLATHREHDVARKQMRGFGGVVSFEVRGDLEATARVVDACRIPVHRRVAGAGSRA